MKPPVITWSVTPNCFLFFFIVIIVIMVMPTLPLLWHFACVLQEPMVWLTRETSCVRLHGMKIAKCPLVTPSSINTRGSCLHANRWLLLHTTLSVSLYFHVYLWSDRDTHTHIHTWLTCPITLFSFVSASVNAIELPQWLTGNCPSEAYDPLAAPADWIAIPDDLISKH